MVLETTEKGRTESSESPNTTISRKNLHQTNANRFQKMNSGIAR